MNSSSYSVTLSRFENGRTNLRGSRDGRELSLDIHRQEDRPQGRTTVSGSMGGDQVELTFHRSARDGYHRISGHFKGEAVEVQIRREGPDGDSRWQLDSDSVITVDRRQQGQRVDIDGDGFHVDIDRELRDGDETVQGRHGRDRIGFSIDRTPRDGGFSIRGVGYQAEASLSEDRSVLHLEGQLPAGAEWFPILWEVLGDDKIVPDRNPYYPSSLMILSLALSGS